MPRKSSDWTERFWNKVQIGSPDACWPWMGARDSNGYGRFVHKPAPKTTMAPRLSFFLTNGFLPEFACHTCDNPSCVNPNHLYDGNMTTNMRDMVERDRQRKGSNQPRSKLIESQVIEVRNLYETGLYSIKKLAKQFGVCHSTMFRAVNNYTWRHLKEMN